MGSAAPLRVLQLQLKAWLRRHHAGTSRDLCPGCCCVLYAKHAMRSIACSTAFAASRRCAECSEVAVSHRHARRTGGLGLGRLGCLARVVASRTAMPSATVCRPYDGDSCGRHACSGTHVFSAVIRRGFPILICGLPRCPLIASRPSLRGWYQSLIAHPVGERRGHYPATDPFRHPLSCSGSQETLRFRSRHVEVRFFRSIVFSVPPGLNTGDLTGKLRT